MHAIAGKITFGREHQPLRHVVVAMTEALAHRGPDGWGFHFAAGIGIGHRRSAPVQEPQEHQPVSNEDGTVWSALDGEILNGSAIGTELEARGHRFRTMTDAELLVHAYEQWGERAIERLEGAFAFVVWDERRRRLVLGRDRLGIRPLHYAVLPDKAVVFASELKALLEDPDVPRDWDPAAIKEYLTLGYVPAPATIFCRIVKLPAAHVLVAEHGRIRVGPYWDLPCAGQTDARPEREHVERLDELLERAVVRQSRDTDPVTALLSSEVGAIAVVGCLSGAGARQIVTSTAAFDEPPFDEVNRTRAIARHFRTRHYTDLVTPDIPELLPRLAWYFDEPLGDPAAVTSYYSAVAARAYGPVAMAPTGSSEIWAGHERHRLEQAEDRARRWLGPLRFPAGLVAPVLPIPKGFIESARRLATPSAEAYVRKCAPFHPGTAGDRLFTVDFAQHTAGVDPLAAVRQAHARRASRDALDRALYVDAKTNLADNVLTVADRVSAATRLAMRLPMLDDELVDFAARVPSALKVRGGVAGYLLRRAAGMRAPRHLLGGSRHPFESDAARWLRGPLAPMASDLLLGGRFRHRGIFDPKAVTRTWQAHLTGARDHHLELWALLMLELWFERFVDRSAERLRAA